MFHTIKFRKKGRVLHSLATKNWCLKTYGEKNNAHGSTDGQKTQNRFNYYTSLRVFSLLNMT